MGTQYFKFKKFTIRHDLCAMKTGTDAVLLGSWCNVFPEARVLDIGTGSGIIALMIAQREPNSTITAIDNDSNAVKQAIINIESSQYNKQIDIQEIDFCRFSETAECEIFDTIVSNPPYYEEDTLSPDQRRNTARHTSSLPFAELIGGASKLLKRTGTFSLIVPCSAARTVTVLAAAEGLYLMRRTDVAGKAGKQPVRSMLEFGKQNVPTKLSTLDIRSSYGDYSDEFKSLTKEFYLNF